MNSVNLLGRLTKDPEVRTSTSGTSVARFTLAIDRISKEKATDFIGCIAFGKTAELIDQYIHKGDKLALSGRIQTGSYEKQDGTKVYTTDVIAERIDFCGGKSESSTPPGFATSDEIDIPF